MAIDLIEVDLGPWDTAVQAMKDVNKAEGFEEEFDALIDAMKSDLTKYAMNMSTIAGSFDGQLFSIEASKNAAIASINSTASTATTAMDVLVESAEVFSSEAAASAESAAISASSAAASADGSRMFFYAGF